MWELDYKESWVPKNWCFQTVVLEKTLESPLDCTEIQTVHPKGNKYWMFIRRTDAEAETLILWLPGAKRWLIWKDAGKDWRWEEKGTTEDEMVGWYLSTLLKKWPSDTWVVALFSPHKWCSNTGLHSEWLLNSSCTVLSLGPMPQKLAMPHQIKKILLPFPALWISSVLQLLFSLISLHPFSGSPILSAFNTHLHLWKFTT